MLGRLEVLFRGPFMASRQYAAWAEENMGYEVPPMNADRLAELATYGIEITLPSGAPVASVPSTAAAAGAGTGAGAGAGSA